MNPEQAPPRPYVILKHSCPDSAHWDFMLESAGALRTWRVDLPPEQLAHTPAAATRIADHPLRFLSYEGPVQQGTASVEIADTGTYTIFVENPDLLDIRLHGKVLRGRFRLHELSAPHWLLTPAPEAG